MLESVLQSTIGYIMKKSLTGLPSNKDLRGTNKNKSKNHSKIIELTFLEKDSGNTLTYIEEVAVVPGTNHNDEIVPSKFYKIESAEDNERKEINEAQAIREMMSLIEKCLNRESEVTYSEHRYLSTGKVTYSY